MNSRSSPCHTDEREGSTPAVAPRRWGRLLAPALLLFAAVALPVCTERGARSPVATAGTEPIAARTVTITSGTTVAMTGGATARVPESFTKNLTPGETALANLSSHIVGLRAGVRAQPASAGIRDQLVGNLLARSQFVGSFADLGESAALATEGRKASSDRERAMETAASALSAVHDFVHASKLLEAIGKADLEGSYGNYQLARGADPRPIEQVRRERALESPTFGTLSSWAIALSAVGEFEAADRAYADALTSYRDVSPFPVAWVEFQRGVMWAERAGDMARGRAHYERATAVLPGYVVANVHLAEVEAGEGDLDSARRRLRLLVDAGTQDPEPRGLLSTLAETKDERALLREEAASRYRALIRRHPLAFLDHAAEFFADVDPEFALELALDNLDNRADDRAYQIAIEAALAAADASVACDLAEQASVEAHPGFQRPTVPLRELAHLVLGNCE